MSQRNGALNLMGEMEPQPAGCRSENDKFIYSVNIDEHFPCASMALGSGVWRQEGR